MKSHNDESSFTNKLFFIAIFLALVLVFLVNSRSSANAPGISHNYGVSEIQNQSPGGGSTGQFSSSLLNGLANDANFRHSFLSQLDNDSNFRGALLQGFVDSGVISPNFADQFDSDINFRESLLNQFDQDANFRSQVLQAVDNWMNTNSSDSGSQSVHMTPQDLNPSLI